MADNVTGQATSSAGAVFATDADDSGSPSIHYAKGKLVFGANNSFTDVTPTSGLPVQQQSGSTWAVSAASLPLPAGASTAAKQAALGVAGTASGDVLTVQGIASMVALKVDGSAVTQPVSAASLPLPTGASISAKQPALGTAGSASIDVITVQGIASMTALRVDGSGVTQPISAASLPLPTGAATSAKQATPGTPGSPASDTLTVQGIASMTALKVDGSAVTQPVSAASLPLPTGASTAAKQPALGTAGSASSDVISVQGIASMTALKVDGSAVAQPVTDNSGSLTVDNAGTFAVQNQAATSGGCSAYSFLSTAAVQAASVKGSAGQVYGISGFNNSTNIAYVRIYNQSTSPGTGDAANIVWRGMIPGNSNGAGFALPLPPGLACGTGIGIRVSAAIADNDATALAANVITGNVLYK